MQRESIEPATKNMTSPLELAVVIPTLNEHENISVLVKAIQHALDGHAFEIIVVDDNSPDGTADVVRELALRNIRVRCIQRFGRRGLSSAFFEGALSTSAPIVALIDGDMQHDETLLPVMLEELRSRQLDLVIGSRYLEPGSFGDWNENRVRASKIATGVARRITGIELSDPMSGFFMIRTEFLRSIMPKLSNIGFKALLDIFLTARTPVRYLELPYQFRSRHSGKSKANAKVLLEFGELLIDKLVGRYVPAKFIMFALVGSVGVLVHLAVLTLLFKGIHADFLTSQTVATLTAMTSNFTLNNILTYHDRRLVGWAWFRGLFTFALASSVGLVANVGVASILFSGYEMTWIVSAIAGIVMGLVWNYVLTSVVTWRGDGLPN